MSKTKKFLLQGLLFCVIFALTFSPFRACLHANRWKNRGT